MASPSAPNVTARPVLPEATVEARTQALHLIVGPAQHGVVRHAVTIARACGHDLLRFERPEDVSSAVSGKVGHDLAGHDVVHLAFTDKLFGRDCESAAAAFDCVTRPLRAAGCRISLTVHDVPLPGSPHYARRRDAYERVLSAATGVVVSSFEELSRLVGLRQSAKSVCVIPLPVPRLIEAPPTPTGREVAVLGFVYPGRGYEQVLDELPAQSGLVALGRAATDHEDLPGAISAHARRLGRSWQLTGFLPDAQLAHHLATAAVPVAPNRQVAASASIATWLSHGRRPLVPRTGYTEELQSRWPETLQLYDADCPGALHDAIVRAINDPSSTILAGHVQPGASCTEVAEEYRRHLQACATAGPIPLAGGTFAVAGNEWRALDGHMPERPPAVSVVIPYFESQKTLDLVLAALTLQTHPLTRLQVIIADDGSCNAPDLGAAEGLDVRLVRQENRGFRAAAARNLGASVADGDILAFLDSDTIPEPDYLTRLCRLPALVPDAVTVGRRRHADFSGWGARELGGWLRPASGIAAPSPPLLTEPGWLVDAYRESDDLTRVDHRSYRFVISAVLGLRRAFFAELGGFSPEFTAYGGEDWELAHRAFCAGAVLSHVRDAVAWHDGPEWAERTGDLVAVKAAETRMLRRLLPDRIERGAGQYMPFPATVIVIDCCGHEMIARTAASAFATGADCGFWVRGSGARAVVRNLGDPRIQCWPATPQVLARAHVLFELDSAADLCDLPQLEALTEEYGVVHTPAGVLRSSAALQRGRRHAASFGADAQGAAQALFGRHDAAFPKRAAAE